LIEVSYNGTTQSIGSVEELGLALDRFGLEAQFHLLLLAEDGSSLGMLRNSPNAWLMYLRSGDDRGLVSRGDPSDRGTIPYRIDNGQIDEYPRSWCIEVEQCYKSGCVFLCQYGAEPGFIPWQEP